MLDPRKSEDVSDLSDQAEHRQYYALAQLTPRPTWREFPRHEDVEAGAASHAADLPITYDPE